MEDDNKPADSNSSKRTKLRILRVLSSYSYYGALLVLTVFWVVQSAQCVFKFYENPTYVSTEIREQMDVDIAEFPAVTICPKNGGFKEDVLRVRPIFYLPILVNVLKRSFQANGIDGRQAYNQKNAKYYDWKGNQTGLNAKQLFLNATYSLTELVAYLTVRTFVSKEGQSQVKVELSTQHERFREQRHRHFGRCFTYYPERSIRQRGIYYMKWKL